MPSRPTSANEAVAEGPLSTAQHPIADSPQSGQLQPAEYEAFDGPLRSSFGHYTIVSFRSCLGMAQVGFQISSIQNTLTRKSPDLELITVWVSRGPSANDRPV